MPKINFIPPVKTSEWEKGNHYRALDPNGYGQPGLGSIAGPEVLRVVRAQCPDGLWEWAGFPALTTVFPELTPKAWSRAVALRISKCDDAVLDGRVCATLGVIAALSKAYSRHRPHFEDAVQRALAAIERAAGLSAERVNDLINGTCADLLTAYREKWQRQRADEEKRNAERIRRLASASVDLPMTSATRRSAEIIAEPSTLTIHETVYVRCGGVWSRRPGGEPVCSSVNAYLDDALLAHEKANAEKKLRRMHIKATRQKKT